MALWQSLLQFDFKNFVVDCSLFIYNSNNIITYVLVYVDDLILASNNGAHLKTLVNQLAADYSLKELQYPTFFLNIKVVPTVTGLFLTQ